MRQEAVKFNPKLLKVAAELRGNRSTYTKHKPASTKPREPVALMAAQLGLPIDSKGRIG